MELIDVLRHGDPPRTEHFVDIPSAYGTLRLDILDPGAALSQVGMTPETAKVARDQIDKARATVEAGDAEGGLNDLIEVVKVYPYSLDGYGALFDYFWDRGDRDKTIYYAQQMIALDPQYRFMTMLGKELGRAGRYEEALVLQDYLWENRHKATPKEAYSATGDYLITLGRAGDPKKMMEVAIQAMGEMGNDSTLVYQYIYAHILDKQYTEARTLLNKGLPNLKGTDPLYSRFMEMSNVLDGLLADEGGAGDLP
jgi:tetratricopeptide (TPR) repeat protein